MKIFDLANIPENALESVGGKAKGLYLLNKYSFEVPNGFILCDAESEKDYGEAYEYYEKANLGKVAVRSSATIEDGENYSNAGQYETFLNVNGKEDFFKAVKGCIESLNNERSQKYGKTFLNGEKDKENKMTVVVQRMVEAYCAGVLFTKDPMDKDGVLIECVKGLGESLVSGEKSAEQYTVKNNEIKYPESPILKEEQVKALYDSAVKIEEKFGMPMDVEWAMDESGKIYFLQARPITVIEDDGVNINEFDFPVDVHDYVITTCNVREMLSTAVTPLSLSTSVYCLDHGMRKMMVENHAVKSLDDLPPYSCITPYYNNMFFNQSTNYVNAYRIAGLCKESTDVAICGRVLEDFPDLRADYSSQLKRILNLTHFLPFILSGKNAKNGIDEVIKSLSFDYDDTLEGLYKQTQDNFPLFEKALFYHYCSSFFSGASTTFVKKDIAKYHKDPTVAEALFSGVLTNIEGIESALIIDMMKDLAGKILKKYPDARSYSKEQLANVLRNARGEIKESYDTFMKANGQRGINECEMRLDCWADNLLLFCDSLKGVVVSYGKEKTNAKDWTEYLNDILKPVPKRKRKSLTKKINKARSGAWHREYSKSRSMIAVCMFRRAYRKIAELMVEKNILPDKDLIYFLTKEEIGELIGGKSALIKKAMKRRRLYPIQCSLKFEEVYLGKPVPIKEETAVEGSSFKGLLASPGVVTGKARIIRSVDDANHLQEGEIMVASCTDVGWTPYYCLASGLITEIGSCLSHGVVVAREYGLPTIVNVRGIMNAVKDGDMITMDGSTGLVTIAK